MQQSVQDKSAWSPSCRTVVDIFQSDEHLDINIFWIHNSGQ